MATNVLSVERDSADFEALTFPLKLHVMLEDAKKCGFEQTIAWDSNGKSVLIQNTVEFTNTIMPLYFKQSQFKSFQRQLNFYGFKRVAFGKLKGAYAHKLFVRGNPELCTQMVRRKPMKKESPSNSTPLHQPRERLLSPKEWDIATISQDSREEDSFWSIRDESSHEVLRQQVVSSSLNEDSYSLWDDGEIDPAFIEAFEPPRLAATPAALARQSREGIEEGGDIPQEAQLMFPCKLHRMLQDAEEQGFENIISWVRGGRAFKVHDPATFMDQVSPNYFDHSKYESFRRQLSIYSFHREVDGPNRGQYAHPLFLRGRWDLCHRIVRRGNTATAVPIMNDSTS